MIMIFNVLSVQKNTHSNDIEANLAGSKQRATIHPRKVTGLPNILRNLQQDPRFTDPEKNLNI